MHLNKSLDSERNAYDSDSLALPHGHREHVSKQLAGGNQNLSRRHLLMAAFGSAVASSIHAPLPLRVALNQRMLLPSRQRLGHGQASESLTCNAPQTRGSSEQRTHETEPFLSRDVGLAAVLLAPRKKRRTAPAAAEAVLAAGW